MRDLGYPRYPRFRISVVREVKWSSVKGLDCLETPKKFEFSFSLSLFEHLLIWINNIENPSRLDD